MAAFIILSFGRDILDNDRVGAAACARLGLVSINGAGGRDALRGLAALLPILLTGLAAPACDVAHAEDMGSTPAQGVVAPPAAAESTISSLIPALGDFKKGRLDRGVDFELDYIQDTFGNPTGGVKQGASYQSVLYMKVDADLAKLAGLTGASFRVNAYQIQGCGLSAYNIDNFSNISSLEARPTTRLYELWAEQKLFADVASVRVGQLAADNELFISEFGNDLYVNGTFGWPNNTAENRPSGGPGYPLATPGARLKVTPNNQVTLLAAIFNGDPAGAGFTGLEQIKDLPG
ncbi:carbohydrate porin [Methylocapsa polymorpha]|uniref:Carbohydrate porin n=1 Tax=Methylocapsa polymorpha TaxID=3080828 RepID=A0ABZ0HTN8_9HYPH|nr:carbohydrate porin [Methylocapsa sp. RX1]